MAKFYTIFFLLLGLTRSTQAQITTGRPTGDGTGIAPWTLTYTTGTNWSNITDSLSNLADGNLATGGTIGISHSYVITDPTSRASVSVAYTIPTTNNGTIFIETAEGSKLVASSSSTEDDEAVVSLWNGDTQYSSSEVSIEERTKPDGSTYYAIHAPSYGTITKLTLTIEGSALFAEEDSIKIKDIFWYNGTADNTDCGIPLSIRTSYTIGGLPITTNYVTNPEDAIDQDETSWASDEFVGLGGIGFFYYSHNIYFNGASNTNNSSIKAVLGNGINIGVNLSGTLYKVLFVNHGTVVDQTDWKTFSVLGLLGILDYSKVTVEATSSKPFDEVIVRIGYAGVNISVLTGEYFRLYEVKRTANAPTIDSSTLYTTYNTPATLTANGIGESFVWRYSTTATYASYDSSGNFVDSVTGLVAVPGSEGIITVTSATATNSDNISTSSYTTGNLTKDSSIFVSSVLSNCTSDTSAAGLISIKIISTEPVLAVSVNNTSTAVDLNWTIDNEYKSRYIKVERRLSGSSDTWDSIGIVQSTALADPDADSLHTNSTTTPTTYTYTDSTVDGNTIYEYRVIVIDNSVGGVESNIAVQPYTLPVAYTKELAVVSDGTSNILTWTTAQEINNKGFHILHSTDSKTWSIIDFISTKVSNGTGTGVAYSYTDKNPSIGTNYYQLKQEDNDGKTSLSNIVAINNKTSDNAVAIYPNPVINTLHIKNATIDYSYRITDFSGRIVLTGIITTNPASINVYNLTSGLYVIELSDKLGNKKGNFKFVKK